MSTVELKQYAERLTVLAGHAINANNGRCALIEDALCKTTTLCCAVLDHLENNNPNVLHGLSASRGDAASGSAEHAGDDLSRVSESAAKS